jgi:hypothetical protein
MAVQNVTFTTPKGTALYPWLSTPDTKFSEEGEYKVNLVLSKEDALPILKQINEVYAENISAETKKANGKEVKKAPPPWAEQRDEAGEPTGNIILRFKSKAAYKPAIFDAKGMPMIDSNIWGGSEIKVSGSIAPYFTSLIGAGIALRLRAVQVIQLVEGSGGAGRFGFTEEAGYTQEAAKASPAAVDFESIAEPVMRAETKVAPQPADDLSDIINQWATK